MKNDAFRGLSDEVKNRIHWLYGRRFYFSGKPSEIISLIRNARITNYDKDVMERMSLKMHKNNNESFLFYFDKSE